jgi:hypothetical protein
MEGYVIGLGIVIITAIIALSICACCCKIDLCRGTKKEKIPLLNTEYILETMEEKSLLVFRLHKYYT